MSSDKSKTNKKTAKNEFEKNREDKKRKKEGTLESDPKSSKSDKNDESDRGIFSYGFLVIRRGNEKTCKTTICLFGRISSK